MGEVSELLTGCASHLVTFEACSVNVRIYTGGYGDIVEIER